MKTYQQFVDEAVSKKLENTEIISPDDMYRHIGAAKYKVLTNHPWFQDNFADAQRHGVPVGMRYRREASTGFESIEVAHGPIGSDKPLRRMAKFNFSYSGRKIDSVHLYHNTDNETHKGGSLDGSLKWDHVKSLNADR